VAINHGDAPGRLHGLRGDQHVVVDQVEPRVIVGLFRARGRAQRHVLDRHGAHRVVVRFQHRRSDDEGVRIEQCGRPPNRNHVRVLVREIDKFEALVFGLGGIWSSMATKAL
jgi:hypothetical protein